MANLSGAAITADGITTLTDLTTNLVKGQVTIGAGDDLAARYEDYAGYSDEAATEEFSNIFKKICAVGVFGSELEEEKYCDALIACIMEMWQEEDGSGDSVIGLILTDVANVSGGSLTAAGIAALTQELEWFWNGKYDTAVSTDAGAILKNRLPQFAGYSTGEYVVEARKPFNDKACAWHVTESWLEEETLRDAFIAEYITRLDGDDLIATWAAA